MERRRFLGWCSSLGLASAWRGFDCAAGEDALSAAKPVEFPLIADAHAHPRPIEATRMYDPATPTIDVMNKLGMTLCSFSAVGDLTYFRRQGGMPFAETQRQLNGVKGLADKGLLHLTLRAADLRALRSPGAPVGAIMAIEGGDALEGNPQNVDAFYQYGVRLITLVHDRDNELGFNQRSHADGPLSAFGVQIVERMNKLGMLVDVAHAKTGTLKNIVAASAMPVIDSHTSPIVPGENGSGLRRLRTWDEMELIAKTGGVVCTWPFAYSGNRSQRTTLGDWAAEIVQMKARLGIEHCALGTDGGGGLPRLVKGWDSIASLPGLMEAMTAAGLTKEDIAAFVGGNLFRILAKCLV